MEQGMVHNEEIRCSTTGAGEARCVCTPTERDNAHGIADRVSFDCRGVNG